MTLADWLERLSPGALPVFAHTRALLIQQRQRVEAIGARDIALAVLSDPLATLQLLHGANLRGSRLGSEVTTAEGALMMLGIGRYLEEASQLSILEESPLAREAKHMAALRALARRIHHAAWQTRDFAALHNDVRAEEVQVAAILHAAPECLLLVRAPREALRLLRLRRRLPAAEAERQVLGISLGELRLPLLAGWNIPEQLRDLLDPDYADKSRQIILKASLNIAEHAQKGWWDESLLEAYQALAGIENMPVEEVIGTAHGNAIRAERAAEWIGVPGAGVWLPMLPGPWPEEADEEEAVPQAQPQSLASTETRKQPSPAAIPPQEETPHAICPMPDKAVLRATLDNIERHLDGSLNLNQMSAIILKGLHDGLGLSRILFAMVTPDGLQTRSRFTLGIPASDPLRQFAFDLRARDLFGQLMGKMQGVWLNAGNREKLWPMIAPPMQAMIGSSDFYAMSLHANGKPLGLIYADRGHGECGLDPHTYTDFKMLCLQAARGLGKLKT